MTLIDLSGNTTDGGTGDGDGVLRAAEQVSDRPCNFRREGGKSLVIGGPSLVILEGKA